jgi:hypothetical protein
MTHTFYFVLLSRNKNKSMKAHFNNQTDNFMFHYQPLINQIYFCFLLSHFTITKQKRKEQL